MISGHNINSISLRYFNPIGVHESILIGDYSKDKTSNLIPIITETAIGKRKKLIIYGNDYNTIDGTCIRDYIHVVDLAIAHVLAMQFILENKGKYVFNVGTGNGISVLEAIKLFEDANQVKIKYSIGKRRSGDIEKIYSCSHLIKEELKWEAKQNIKKAMQSAWQWEKSK